MSDVPNPVPSPVEGQRSFGLNSPEFYEFVRVPEPHVWGPRSPRWRVSPDLEVIVEIRRPKYP